MKQPLPSPVRGATDIVTRLTKIAGVAVTINETLLRAELRPIALAVAALMIAGAQGLESVLDRLLK